MLDTEKHTLHIDPRAYNFMKTTAITNVVDGLVELITNSDDAYQRRGGEGPYPIQIEVDYHVPKKGTLGRIIVTDQALGLTAQEMQDYFTNVGIFSSTRTSRGFFSRGAKDISALGNVAFHAFKDGHYSCLHLYEDSSTQFTVLDAPVTEEQRAEVGIPENGLRVEILLLDSFELPDPDFFFEKFPKTLSIRNILSSPHHQISMKTSGHDTIPDREEQIKYRFPVGKILLDVIYQVPKYNVEAHFIVFKYDQRYVGEVDRRYNESGFMITSQNVIHDHEGFGQNFNFNPDLQYLFGSIHCDHINTLLHEFDANSKDQKNPFPLIDPNRIGGINKRHPFYRSLISIPLNKIQSILADLDNAAMEDLVMNINLHDFANLAKQLELIDTDVVKSDQKVQVMVKDPKSKLIKTTKGHRKKFITVERNFAFQLHLGRPEEAEEEESWDSGSVDPGEGGPRRPRYGRRKIRQLLDILTRRFVPSVVTNGNYQDVPDEEPSTYTLYKEVSDQVATYDLKELYVQDRVNFKNNVINPGPDDSWVQGIMSNELQILFRRDDTDNYKYKIKKSGTQVTIIINTGNTVLSTFMNTETSLHGTTSSKAIIMLNEMLTDAFVRLMVEKQVRGKKDMFQAEEAIDIVNEVYTIHDNNVKLVEDLVFNIIQKLLARRKKAKQGITKV